MVPAPLMLPLIDQRGGARAFIVGADDGVLVVVGQRRRRADGERDRALDLQRRRIARAVELDRAAGDGVADQLHRAAVIATT